LAKFFRVAKLCENAGYGFDKMLQWKKQTGNEVLFETSIDKTKFTFMLDTTKAIREESGTKGGMKDEESGMKSSTVEEKSSTNITENNQKLDEKTTRKQPENTQKTTRKQPEEIHPLIIELIKSNDKISRSEMAEKLNLTEGSLRHHLEYLKNKGFIRREGADKGGKWVIIKPD
jgi:ATP-dependent DNA helicase RecG